MLNDIRTPLALLETRRSGKPRDMIAPGPDADQLRTILEIATRVPDHGKLAPWRFVVVGSEQRGRFADLLAGALAAEKPAATPAEIDSALQFAHQAPALVVALSSPIVGHKIPEWEQQLSVGAACLSALLAAHAQGFVGSWLTGWAAYSKTVVAAFGEPHEKIAGFLFFGTPARALEERARPDYPSVVRYWG